MQLVATVVDIPQQEKLQLLEINAAKLRSLKKAKLLSIEAYVLFAIEMTYPGKSSLSVHTESFCEQWKLKPYELSTAIAKLQKKNLIDCETDTVIQLELFELENLEE